MILSLALLSLAAATANVDRSALAPAFTGTIVSTYPDGRTGTLNLHEDGTYDGVSRHHNASSGHWRLKGDQVCMKQGKPIWLPVSYCTPVPTTTAWEAKAPTGEPIHVRLEPRAR